MLPYSPEQSIPQRFAAVLAARAEAPAIIALHETLTYREMDARANAVAQHLGVQGEPGRERVLLLLRHDIPLFPALLGVLKAGKVAVVLNATDPLARLVELATHAEPSAIVTDLACEETARKVADCLHVPMVQVGGLQPTAEAACDPQIVIPPTALAALIYTSGSTGKPKAVMQTHRNIIHNVLRYTASMQLTSEDRILSLASLSGGQGMATAWQAFLNGATLVPFAAMESGLNDLATRMNAQRVSVYISSASLFRHFVQTLSPDLAFPSVRIVRLASESASADLYAAFHRHFPSHARLYQTFSSSETGNITQFSLTQEDAAQQGLDGQIPVGVPSHGVGVALLDDHGHPVPEGTAGEIVVGSDFLSPGYWKHDALTAERFSTGPDGTRVFRTGDRGRFHAGMLHYLGRNDHQVKIRGFRVELSEVEAALQRLPGVRGAIVIARESDQAGTSQLIAYVTLHPGVPATGESLRAGLRDTVSRHLIPSAFVILDQFPLNANGKVDRAALPTPAAPPAASAGDAPRTATERQLAAIWESVFHRTISRDADFFELGGDSLSAAVIAARLNAERGLAVDYRFFVDHPGLSEQAGRIEAMAATPLSVPIPSAGVRDAYPLSFEQESVASRCEKSDAGFIVAVSHRIIGPLRVPLLERCINQLVDRHAALRTRYRRSGSGYVQTIPPHVHIPLPVIDLQRERDPGAAAAAFLRQEAARPMRLTSDPLLRFSLLQLGPEAFELVRVNHHINSDAWSWRHFFRELAELYECEQPQASPDQTATLRYVDYAVWQREALDSTGGLYRSVVDWWHNRLKGCQALELPFSNSRLHARWRSLVRRSTSRDPHFWWPLSPGISAGLAQGAAATGVTPFNIRLALLLLLLARTTGQRDLLIGIQTANRLRLETQSIFGFFANRFPLRVQVDFTLPLHAWCNAVQRSVAESQSRALLPFDLLAAELKIRGLAPPPLRALFALTYHLESAEFGGLKFSWHDRTFEARPGQFTLAFNQLREATRNRVSFHPFKHDPARIGQFLDQFARLLAAAPQHLSTPLDRVPL